MYLFIFMPQNVWVVRGCRDGPMSKKSLWQMSLNSRNEKSVSVLFIDTVKGQCSNKFYFLFFETALNWLANFEFKKILLTILFFCFSLLPMPSAASKSLATSWEFFCTEWLSSAIDIHLELLWFLKLVFLHKRCWAFHSLVAFIYLIGQKEPIKY